MSTINLINASCADQTVDAVVNAANSGLWAGGGICGVIFSKAGMSELTDHFVSADQLRDIRRVASRSRGRVGKAVYESVQ